MTGIDVRKLGLLARLELDDHEVEHLGTQLNSILGFVEQLQEVDTQDVEPMTTALDVDNCWRPDRVSESLAREDAMRNAPQSDGECFLVPPVLGPGATKH